MQLIPFLFGAHRVHSRGAPRRALDTNIVATFLVLTVVAGGVTSLPSSSAAADPVADAKAQAAAVMQKIQATDVQLQSLTDQYSAADYKLSQVNAAIVQTQAQMAANQREVIKDRTRLQKQAIQQYMSSGTSSNSTDMFTSNVNEAGVRTEYSSIASGNIATTIDTLGTAQTRLRASQDSLKSQQNQASATRNSLMAAKSQAGTLVAQEQATLSSVNANIQALVAQQKLAQQLAAAAAAAAAFKSRVAAAQVTTTPSPTATQGTAPHPTTATTAGSGNGSLPSVGDTKVPPQPLPPPPPLPGGTSSAVQAAVSQVGVPYVWGGASPSGFDCSGLVMWAYAQVGINLPHYSGAQYSATVHIPLADIQPGDLLFYGPGGSDHEAMYIGGGSMVEATHTGDFVRIDGVRSDGGLVVGRVQ
jgi:cell wall-associated NlpC family hydrolase